MPRVKLSYRIGHDQGLYLVIFALSWGPRDEDPRTSHAASHEDDRVPCLCYLPPYYLTSHGYSPVAFARPEERGMNSIVGGGGQPGAKVYSGCTTEARQPRQPDVWGPLTSLDGVRVLVETLSSLP